MAASDSDKGAAKDPAGDAAAKPEKIVIKKYANRRLYNTAKSSYVTLDDLSRMVRSGQDFAVYDAKTGDDITRSVLTQIIFEEEAKGQSMLPTNFLRQIIGLYGDTLQGVVPSYLDASMETFAKNQEQMRKAFNANQPMTNFGSMASGNVEWFEQAMRMFSPFGAAAGGVVDDDTRDPGGAKDSGVSGADDAKPPGSTTGDKPRRDPAPEADLTQDLDLLKRQLGEMQAQLELLTRGKG